MNFLACSPGSLAGHSAAPSLCHCQLQASQQQGTPASLEELQAELRTLASNIAAQYPEHAKEAARQRAATNKKSGHPLATAVSLVVGDVENCALLAMMRELQVQGRCVTTLVYDGLHVLRLEGETELPAELLRAWSSTATRISPR